MVVNAVLTKLRNQQQAGGPWRSFELVRHLCARDRDRPSAAGYLTENTAGRTISMCNGSTPLSW